MPTFARFMIALIFLVLAAHTQTHSHATDLIVGKVVAVADGDTIMVLENRVQYRIRLFGIDAPERRQDFGNRTQHSLPLIWCLASRSWFSSKIEDFASLQPRLPKIIHTLFDDQLVFIGESFGEII